MVGRPETISCERCDATVAVKAKGPVPSFCAPCRRTRTRATRPERVDCERCGAEVVVGSRGPVPRYCRDGCQDGNGRSSARVVRRAVPQADVAGPGPEPPLEVAVVAPARVDMTVTSIPVEEPAPAPFQPTNVTRMSTIDPDGVLDRQDLGRTARLRRLRHNAAIAAWLIIVLAVMLILFVGSRPAPTDFQSYASLLV